MSFVEHWHHSHIVNPHNYAFCPKCGNTLQIRHSEPVPRLQCQACDFIFYQNPVPAVGAILVRDNQVLLVKRKYEPRIGDWSLPAGFVEFGETLKDALLREVKEETNLDIRVGPFFDVYNAVDDPRNHIVLILYRGEIISGELKPGDDALEASFFPLDKLPSNIAFSCHVFALQRLRQESSAQKIQAAK